MAVKQRLVVKLGTSTLTGGSRNISAPRLVDLVRQVSQVHDSGWEVILVSSGAIAAGREVLDFPELPRHIPKKQMLAAVGQPALMARYADYFSIYNQRVAQVLLTRADLTDRRRYLNARNTFQALLTNGVIPIVNENDTLATEEIRFGDNDNLSAHVAGLVEADILVLLTDQEGLYTGDPRTDPQARLIREVQAEESAENVEAGAGDSQSGLGTGGMATKVHAADIARKSGIQVFIARGDQPDVLLRIAGGEHVGTRFMPVDNRLESRKRFLLAGERSGGCVVVDGGAARALVRGSSLLAVGVTGVEGDFDRGDTIRVLNSDKKTLAIGQSNYSSKEVELLRGRKSNEIDALLGYSFGEEVIHRNAMVLVR
ncbi:MAG: glutamate 5-kinase [Anaerolineae bacterium]|nr:glutamate 5-kinase [Anaerolineae bacterium]